MTAAGAEAGAKRLPLEGVRVLELATLFAGPLAATYLGDYGAEVIKIEHPVQPDASRGHGVSRNGIGLWWKTIGRNKSTVTADLHTTGGREVLLRLVKDADVLIENFRPGTIEKWGLGPEVLREANPGLVLARVTAFGQDGPYADRPGFGSLAEAMSGFAAANGEPDSAPTLPPFALADGIAALATAFAIMVALRDRDRTGHGQDIDLAIIEPIVMMLGAQITAYDQLRLIQPRTGNRSPNNAPRNVYQAKDEVWLAVSASAQTVAERVMTLVGRPDMLDEPWFASGRSRAEHGDEIDEAVATWIGERTAAEVITAFEQADAAVAPVYNAADLMEDPQYRARGTVHYVDDPDLGRLAMQNVIFRLSETPGRIKWGGRRPGADTDSTLAAAGFTVEDIAELRATGAI
ncbi:crotonobetainyl-CoA:carnitine CoA-transferase CaiB-like acyl-CoA transferase [Nakamurella sp. UYEF19]|uniref:CaiB/BaiF CoA transferase family protein n=1 Tax=Nakamurella sp. UYEF19 TaxID=1756392 RepID=UPI0033986A49